MQHTDVHSCRAQVDVHSSRTHLRVFFIPQLLQPAMRPPQHGSVTASQRVSPSCSAAKAGRAAQGLHRSAATPWHAAAETQPSTPTPTALLRPRRPWSELPAALLERVIEYLVASPYGQAAAQGWDQELKVRRAESACMAHMTGSFVGMSRLGQQKDGGGGYRQHRSQCRVMQPCHRECRRNGVQQGRSCCA